MFRIVRTTVRLSLLAGIFFGFGYLGQYVEDAFAYLPGALIKLVGVLLAMAYATQLARLAGAFNAE